MSVEEKHRPALLKLSKDKTTSDMIMRIVSPITPQFVSLDMRDTLRISELIRLQQNELIAAGKYGVYEGGQKQTPVSSNWADAPLLKTSSSSGTDGGIDPKSQPTSAGGASHVNADHEIEDDNYTMQSNNRLPSECTVVESDCHNETHSDGLVPVKLTSDSYDSSPTDDMKIERISDGFSRKTFKRSNAPGPLRVSAKALAASLTPMINSAPMRSIYGAPHAFRRQPMRYACPPMAHMPQSSIHYVQTPVWRSVAMAPERVFKPHLPHLSSARRRKPVLDVFEGLVAKLAPMPSQPPSAQLEKFDVSHSDDEKATQEEMEEMELKRTKATSSLRGSISFNNESVFKFTIFQGNENSAKKKFLEVCETTWDKYMANSIGS